MNATLLDPVRVPLRGTLLVEASAGTGKTWTIGALLLRFVIEEGLLLPDILVLTFTEAATAELRDRLRRRLENARQELEGRPVPLEHGDFFLRDLRLKLETEGRWDGAQALLRLRGALAAFDEASIFTIHGFCQRVLTEGPLALGLPPRLELGSSASSALESVALDELRRWWHRLPAGLLDWLAAGQGGPNLLDPSPWMALAGRRDTHPDAELVAPAWRSLDEARAALELMTAAHHRTTENALFQWREAGVEALTRLINQAPLNKGSYRPAKVGDELVAVLAWLERGAPPGDGGKTAKYATERLAERVNKGGEAPRHLCFDRLQELVEAESALVEGYAAVLAFLQWECLATWPARAARLRLERRQLDFGDLLTKVRDGLAGPGGGALAAQLRLRWRAALVDEFQDTDPVQAEIFRRIFRQGGLPLVLVGDPKQAIYGFRGADLHSYLSAAREADQRAGLEANWRSDAGLIQALNLLFAHERFPDQRGAFLQPAIQARPVQPSGRADERALVLEGRELPALLVLQAEQDRLSKPRAGQLVCRHLAQLLSRLLRPSPGGLTGWRRRPDGGELDPVQGREIAVLVRTNHQGRAVAEALADVGLASIQSGQESVWQSDEASEMTRFLVAMARPADTGAARALLAGPLAGALGATPAEALLSTGLLERLQGELHRALQEARGTGLATALAALLERLGWPETLLGLRRGERRLVNWQHLLDLLRLEEATGWSDPAEMALRLHLRRSEPAAQEETELRLESEENLVRVLTQHKCKGLEFPLVICPFLWAGPRKADVFGAALLHDAEGQARLAPHSRPLPPSDTDAREMADEALAETLRLAYVALTRARSQVLLYSLSGNSSHNEPGALNWLLSPDLPPEHAAPGTREAWKGLDKGGAALQEAAWRALAAEAPGHLGVELLPGPLSGGMPMEAGGTTGKEGAAGDLAARPFLGQVLVGERTSSFTSLMTGAHADERRDEWFGPEAEIAGELDDAPEGDDDRDWRARFPRGARAGTCLHKVLEAADFTVTDAAALEALCRRELRAHGLDGQLAPGTARWLREVLEAPLDERGFRLSGLASGRRVAELEFHLPVDGLAAGALEELSRRHGLLDPARLGVTDGELRGQLGQAAQVGARGLPAGFLKGFIDLCHVQEERWWVLDWKSNHLGARAACYTREVMLAEMTRSGYFHQALLYLTALHRHLGRTLPGYDPDRHLGGLRYLFLRGIDPESAGTGVFTDRPPLELVLELDRALGGRPCR